MSVAEEKTAQMLMVARNIAEGAPGTHFWASPTRARMLMEKGAAIMVNAGAPASDGAVLKRGPGWPADRFSVVSRAWEGRTVVLLAGGPSLTLEQVELVRAARERDEVRVIAINDAYLWAPFADICYFGDSKWWRWHSAGIAKPALGLAAPEVAARFAAFAGEKCSIQNSGANVDDPAVHIMRNATHPKPGMGLSLDPAKLMTGRNSGFQALNLAILAGAKAAILLGYDAREPNAGRPSHWFGEHPTVAPAQAYAYYRRAFAAAATAIARAGVIVINTTPGSAIECFEKMPLEDALD